MVTNTNPRKKTCLLTPTYWMYYPHKVHVGAVRVSSEKICVLPAIFFYLIFLQNFWNLLKGMPGEKIIQDYSSVATLICVLISVYILFLWCMYTYRYFRRNTGYLSKSYRDRKSKVCFMCELTFLFPSYWYIATYAYKVYLMYTAMAQSIPKMQRWQAYMHVSYIPPSLPLSMESS